MGYIQGDGRNQGTLFPVVLDDFVPADHVCRVIDAFVEITKIVTPCMSLSELFGVVFQSYLAYYRQPP
jgi:hypothetical protein